MWEIGLVFLGFFAGIVLMCLMFMARDDLCAASPAVQGGEEVKTNLPQDLRRDTPRDAR